MTPTIQTREPSPADSKEVHHWHNSSALSSATECPFPHHSHQLQNLLTRRKGHCPKGGKEHNFVPPSNAPKQERNAQSTASRPTRVTTSNTSWRQYAAQHKGSPQIKREEIVQRPKPDYMANHNNYNQRNQKPKVMVYIPEKHRTRQVRVHLTTLLVLPFKD